MSKHQRGPIRREDGSIWLEDQEEGTLRALQFSAVAHGETKAADNIGKILESRENPDLHRHSRRRR